MLRGDFAGIATKFPLQPSPKRTVTREPGPLAKSTSPPSVATIAWMIRPPRPDPRRALRPGAADAVILHPQHAGIALLFQDDADRAALRLVGIGIFQRVGDEFRQDDTERHRAIRRHRQRRRVEIDARAFDAAADLGEQPAEVVLQRHAPHVGRGVEPAMHLGHRGDAVADGSQRRARARVGQRVLLQPGERGDDLQAVGDAVVDLLQEQGAAGGEFLGTVQRLPHRGLGLGVAAAHGGAVDGSVDGAGEQQQEGFAGRLHHEILGAGAQCRDRDAGLVGAGDEDDRGGIGQGVQ
jgi:hypothetical protein